MMEGQANFLLLEAEYLQIVSSIRALFSSNMELKEALKAEPTDPDFQQAVRENVEILQKKRRALLQLVTDMRRQGGTMLDVPPDIQNMDIESWVENPFSKTTDNHGHDDGATSYTDEHDQIRTTSVTTATNGDAGIYL
mmetsp:Transcript_25695/g.71785  ORF Transcript_25695/g.71785 Transcript_25695/m.71785 type:complete len:138 (+) Transcript_25695:123-536(+)